MSAAAKVAAHTPGPWRYQGETETPFGPGERRTTYHVYNVGGGFVHVAAADLEGNACLIAAAPELADELVNARCHRCGYRAGVEKDHPCEECDGRRDALKRAGIL